MDQYTFFDACILQSMPTSHDFEALGAAAQACVARREQQTGAQPPSEPQMQIGVALRPTLPLYAFAPPNPASAPAAFARGSDALKR
jgi:hypothetical protein